MKIILKSKFIKQSPVTNRANFVWKKSNKNLIAANSSLAEFHTKLFQLIIVLGNLHVRMCKLLL